MRRLIEFSCAGETMIGTLDEARGTTGLLIVSGGNELRMGAHRGMAMLAQRLAAAGVPVFRFDRRGIGDSTGQNGGFAESAEDITAAVAALKAAAPHVTRVAGFGNCDAASALALFHARAGLDTLVLANPWLREEADELPPTAAIRSRYLERLRDPQQWLRLLRGGVDLRKLFRGLSKLVGSRSQPADPLAERVIAAVCAARPVVLLARGDATAQAFDAAAKSTAGELIAYADTDSHSFARAGDQDWLYEKILAAVRK
jgi:exosortase A-associated hydrolase 1